VCVPRRVFFARGITRSLALRLSVYEEKCARSLGRGVTRAELPGRCGGSGTGSEGADCRALRAACWRGPVGTSCRYRWYRYRCRYRCRYGGRARGGGSRVVPGPVVRLRFRPRRFHISPVRGTDVHVLLYCGESATECPAGGSVRGSVVTDVIARLIPHSLPALRSLASRVFELARLAVYLRTT
jgi:hypothetical protein